MINLITSFYLPKHQKRCEEIKKCLIKNIECPQISKIHLFLDNQECKDYIDNNLDTKKIVVIKIGKQPLYSDLFEYANTLKDEKCMIANSDIWLFKITKPIFLKLLDNKFVFPITRHEHDLSCPKIVNYHGSHDAFLFKSPINNNLLKHIKHPQNVWGSENVLMYELKRHGYHMLNICKVILIIHEHESELREKNRIRINNGGKHGNYRVRTHKVIPTF